MKIGIIGSGPDAAEAAIRFNDIGADVRVYATTPWLERWHKHHQAFGLDDFGYGASLLSKLEEKQIKLSLCEVKRIHKSRLTLSQAAPEGKSRLSDMFRIVVSENPETGVLKQVSENPEIFNKLGDDVLNSLQEPVESFHDIDLVVCCFDELFTQPGLTPSGAAALNEHRALDSIVNLKNLWDQNIAAGSLVVVGGNAEALARASGHAGDIVHIPIDGENGNCEKWQELIVESNSKWNADKDLYQKKIFEWRELEDYIRVKVPMPSEPKSKVETIESASIVAVDRLIDREGLFVTIEMGESEDIFTRSFSSILNARKPQWDEHKFKGLALALGTPEQVVTSSEPGFYCLGGTDSTIWSSKASLNELEEIISDVMKWFRPAGEM